MNTATATSWQTLENVEVECTHCGVRMTPHASAGSRVRYFRCGGCHRWVSSPYTDVFRSDAKMRTYPAREDKAADASFVAVKEKLERWLGALEDQDPYRVLGVSPLESLEAVRARYRELAMQAHPDRGGSADRMRELNAAYERILAHRERKRAEAVATRTAVPARVGVSLPARGR